MPEKGGDEGKRVYAQCTVCLSAVFLKHGIKYNDYVVHRENHTIAGQLKEKTLKSLNWGQ